MTGAVIIMVGFWGGVLAYPVLQYIAIKRLRNGWRNFAYLPLVVMALTFWFTLVSLFQQSNLWPVVLIVVSPFILIYLATLIFSHAIYMRGKNEQYKKT